MTESRPTDLQSAVRLALDRDVSRAAKALSQWPHPDPSQRAAIARHVVWMMEEVARHGVTSSSAAPELAGAARRYGADARSRDEVIAALGRFIAELEAGFEMTIDPARCATTAHWLMDDLTGREYRRDGYRRWYLPRHSRLKRRLGARVSVDVAAPVETVWEVVADPTRTSEWSHECRGVEFLNGATESGPDVRFKGVNRSGRTTWSRTCTIFAFEPHRAFGYVTSGSQGDATAWHFRLEPTTSGTRLEQAYQIVSLPAWMSSDALRDDLRKIGALAEQRHRRGSPA